MPLWLRYSSGLPGGDTNDMAIYMATVPNQGAPAATEPRDWVSSSRAGGAPAGAAFAPRQGERHLVVIPTINLNRSVGAIGLASADAAEPPRIKLNYLSEGADVARLREGVRLGLRLGNSPEMAAVVAEQLAPPPSVLTAESSDADIDAYVAAGCETGHHVSGTARMGAADNPLAVCDEEGRVHGIRSLRVVDASLMPDCVRSNTNATVLMMAERLAAATAAELANAAAPAAAARL